MSNRLFSAILMGAVCAVAGLVETAVGAEALLRVHKGERIALVGSSLAQRMNLFGNFEALLHGRFAKDELVVRNFGWPTDEVGRRQRPNDYTKLDDPIKFFSPETFVCFFGFNESFDGPGGVEKYKSEYEGFIKEYSKRYAVNGQEPRFVLVSPIAYESTGDRLLPDGKKENENLKLYAAATAEVAKKLKLPFVDLYEVTAKAFGETPGNQYTINGVHVNEAGDRLVAMHLDRALFGEEGAAKLPEAKEKQLRAAVNDKSWVHLQDYRMVNGWYVYGGRNTPFGVQNFPAEFRKIRNMVAKRDRYVWDIAQGKQVSGAVDDSDTGDLLDVKTTFGTKQYSEPPKLRYLTPGEAMKEFKVAPGYEVQLFASEEQFPEIANPVQINFDGRGRMWVACMPTYPQWRPGDPKPGDKLVILEDTDGDGKADKSKVFADDLHVPTGFEFFNGGVLVVSQPKLMFMKDTDGDDVADVKIEYMDGFATDDTHHAIGAFEYGNGGLLYMLEGISMSTTVETPWGPFRNLNTSVCYKLDPKTMKLGHHVTPCFANPWCFVVDGWGQEFVGDGTGAQQYWATPLTGAPFSGRKGSKTFISPGFRPALGSEIVSSRHFPESAQGNYLIANVIGFNGIGQFRVKEEGSGYVPEKIEPLLESNDKNFRPADPQIGPDGALYFGDWHNALIGHMQYSQRDPQRDHVHGRVYRLIAKDRPLLKPVIVEGRPVAEVLEALKEYESRTRAAARRELRAREMKEVLAALEKWIGGLNKSDAKYEHQLCEALWVQQGHHAVDAKLLKQLLEAKDYHARAAATRVLADEWERIEGAMSLLKPRVSDEHPRVRVEALRAISFGRTPEAVELALTAANLPMDEYVAYTLESALGALYPIWEPMLAKGTIAAGNAKGLEQLVAYDEGRKPYGQAPRLIKTLMNSEADARTKERAMRDLTRMKGKVEAGSIVSTRICITCHKFGAAGTELGPDLADVGKRLSKEELVRSILYPNEKIDPKFLTVNITTKKRDEISGIVAAEDENTVTIRMGAGEQQVVKKADIAKRVTLKVSSMPEDLVQTMSPQEFVDLIEYLASKK